MIYISRYVYKYIYIWGLVLFMISGIHEGSWNITPVDGVGGGGAPVVYKIGGISIMIPLSHWEERRLREVTKPAPGWLAEGQGTGLRSPSRVRPRLLAFSHPFQGLVSLAWFLRLRFDADFFC